MQSKRVTQNGTISFRLRPSFLACLNGLAEQNKQSPGEFARKLVIDGLTDDQIRRDVELLRDELSLLREDLVTTVAYVMQLSGKLDAEEARRAAELLFRASSILPSEDHS